MVKGQVVRGQWHVSSVLFNTAVDLAGDPMNIVCAILCYFHGGTVGCMPLYGGWKWFL